MFRRVFLLLLALLLPLKVATAGVVSLVGLPGHAHVVPQHEHAPQTTSVHAEDAGCAHQKDDAPATPLHDHACPSLGMVWIASAVPIAEPQRAVAALNAAAAPHFASVFHDVPAPIPLAISAR